MTRPSLRNWLDSAAFGSLIWAFFQVPGQAAAQAYSLVPPSGSSGYYIPVAPQPQAPPPCGIFDGDPCPIVPIPPGEVNIPSDATAEQFFDMGQNAFARRQDTLAAVYFERAAGMGYVLAEASLGLMYFNGNGENVDDQKAIYWLTKAADQGDRVAEAQLGDIYEDGDGVQTDEPLAIEYYQKSVAQHWWEAELRLGLDYELGNGVPRSRAEAIALLNRAANDGQDGLSQNIAAMLERPDTPQFANLDQLSAYLGTLWGHAPSYPGGGGNGAGAQYERNARGGVGSQCNGPYQGQGCGYGATMRGEDNSGGDSGGGSDDGDN